MKLSHHQKKDKKTLKQMRMNTYCRNDFQRAVFELAEKDSPINGAEFWVFMRGVEACLSMDEKKMKELKDLLHKDI